MRLLLQTTYIVFRTIRQKTPFTIVGMPVLRTPILEVTDPFHTEYSSIKRSNRILGILGPRPPVSRYSRGRSTQQTLYYPYPQRSREPRRYRIPIQVEYDRENTEHPDTWTFGIYKVSQQPYNTITYLNNNTKLSQNENRKSELTAKNWNRFLPSKCKSIIFLVLNQSCLSSVNHFSLSPLYPSVDLSQHVHQYVKTFLPYHMTSCEAITDKPLYIAELVYSANNYTQSE